MTKVIIAGGRNILDYDLIVAAIEESGWKDQITEVVSGGADGVDKLGERWAMDNLLYVRRFNANWKMYGNRAGPIRNGHMAEYVKKGIELGIPGGLILIWDGKSKGSKSMKEQAERVGIPIREKTIQSLPVTP
jgi:hypothetical protein